MRFDEEANVMRLFCCDCMLIARNVSRLGAKKMERL